MGCHLREALARREQKVMPDLGGFFSPPDPASFGEPLPVAPLGSEAPGSGVRFFVEERSGRKPRYFFALDGDLVIDAENIIVRAGKHFVLRSKGTPDPNHPGGANFSIWLNPEGEMNEDFIPQEILRAPKPAYRPFAARKKGLFGARKKHGCGCNHS